MNRSRVRGPYARFCERDEVRNYSLTSPYSIMKSDLYIAFMQALLFFRFLKACFCEGGCIAPIEIKLENS